MNTETITIRYAPVRALNLSEHARIVQGRALLFATWGMAIGAGLTGDNSML